MKFKQLAMANLAALANNPYPGRVLIVGMDMVGKKLRQVYALTGRGEGSRNRVLISGPSGLVSTKAANPSKMKDQDAALRIYPVMREVRGPGGVVYCVVSNGSQTETVAEGYEENRSMHTSLQNVIYEPDPPISTQRITASCRWERGKPILKMSIERKSPFNDACDHHFHEYNGFRPGFGYCIQTYAGDGDPPPPFFGEPYLLPLMGDAEWTAALYASLLNRDNFVAIVVKDIPAKGGASKVVILNRYSEVP